VDCRADFLLPRSTIPDAGLDVRNSAGAVRGDEGAFLLCRRGLSQAAGDGAVAAERWILTLRQGWRWTVEAGLFVGIALCGMYFAVVIIPRAPSGGVCAEK
jgi:hypothetical protein